LGFGKREDLLDQVERRSEQLRGGGFQYADVYNPADVGGTSVIYVLAHSDRPEAYGLPRDPHIPWTVWLWKGPHKMGR